MGKLLESNKKQIYPGRMKLLHTSTFLELLFSCIHSFFRSEFYLCPINHHSKYLQSYFIYHIQITVLLNGFIQRFCCHSIVKIAQKLSIGQRHISVIPFDQSKYIYSTTQPYPAISETRFKKLDDQTSPILV